MLETRLENKRGVSYPWEQRATVGPSFLCQTLGVVGSEVGSEVQRVTGQVLSCPARFRVLFMNFE